MGAYLRNHLHETVEVPTPDRWVQYRVTDHAAMARCRTDVEAYSDGACRRCRLDCRAHFMVESNPARGEWTKLCTLDLVRLRPFAFSLHRVFGDVESPRPRTPVQVALF